MKTIDEAAKDYVKDFGGNPELSLSEIIEYAIEDFKAGAEFAQRWIPVDDELPEKDGMYLVKSNYDGIVCRPFNSYYNCWDQEDGDDFYSESVGGKVTHWRPIELK